VNRRQRGYSLLELALAMVVMGVIAAMALSLTPRLTGLFQKNTQSGKLLRVDRALTGFALAHSRLPCPDNNADGNEDCGGAAVGGIPYQTLKMSRPASNRRGIGLRYAVYRNANAIPSQDADLAVLKDRYVPLLPSAPPVNLNGLDFCLAVRTAARASASNALAHVGSGVQNVAYAIADPGVNGTFDGLNGATGAAFEQPDRALATAYDDAVRAVGFNELASSLDCASTLAKVNGLARATFVAADMARLADLYQQFRDFSVRVNDTNLTLAGVSLANAIMDETNAIAALALSVAGAFESFGAAAVVGIAGATAALAVSTAGIALAGTGLAGAVDSKATAQTQQTAANTSLAKANTFAAQQRTMVASADARGLLR